MGFPPEVGLIAGGTLSSNEPYWLPPLSTTVQQIGQYSVLFLLPGFDPDPPGGGGWCGDGSSGGGGAPAPGEPTYAEMYLEVCSATAEFIHLLTQDLYLDGATLEQVAEADGVFEDVADLMADSPFVRDAAVLNCPSGLSFDIFNLAPSAEMACPQCVGIGIHLLRQAALYGIAAHKTLTADLRALAAAGQNYAANVHLPKVIGEMGHRGRMFLDGLHWDPVTRVARIIELKPQTESGMARLPLSLARYVSRLNDLRINNPNFTIQVGNASMRVGDILSITTEGRTYPVPPFGIGH
jgi:hypothetical protein